MEQKGPIARNSERQDHHDSDASPAVNDAPKHQSYLPASLTANTNRSDSYFDGDELDEIHERPG